MGRGSWFVIQTVTCALLNEYMYDDLFPRLLKAESFLCLCECDSASAPLLKTGSGLDLSSGPVNVAPRSVTFSMPSNNKKARRHDCVSHRAFTLSNVRYAKPHPVMFSTVWHFIKGRWLSRSTSRSCKRDSKMSFLWNDEKLSSAEIIFTSTCSLCLKATDCRD